MTNDHETDASQREIFLFQHLVLMFQTLAFQQLGKIVNPITGTTERDLRQARITIDMLQMLQAKTAGNLAEGEKRLLDTAVLELQMNYVDESKRPDESAGDEPAKSAGGEPAKSGDGEPAETPPAAEKPASGEREDAEKDGAGDRT